MKILKVSALIVGIAGLPLTFVACENLTGFTVADLTSKEPETSSDDPATQCLPLIDRAGVLAEKDQGHFGLNLPQLSYWDQSFAMADVFRQANFVDTSWGPTPMPDLAGAPGSDFKVIFSSRTIAGGRYKLTFKGRANVSLGGASGAIENKVYDSVANLTVADVVLTSESRGNVWLSFDGTRRAPSSTVADGVASPHLWRPGYPTDGSQIFTREFIQAMRKVQILRAMDMTATNSNDDEIWSDRSLPDYIGRPRNSAQSWELLILLANATDRDIWINIPVKANDEYIQKLVKLFKYGSDGSEPYASPQASPVFPPLKAGLKLYFEYGNEVWNFGGGFYNFGWVHDLSNAVRNTAHTINYDGKAANDEWLALRRFIAYRSAYVSQAFRSIWGDGAMMTTVRPILAAQAANANGYLGDGLAWAEATEPDHDVRKIWWGGGGATYYGAEQDPQDVNPETMATYFNGVPSAGFGQAVAKDTVILRGYGLHHISYEGGPEPGATGFYSGSDMTNVANIFSIDPRMPLAMGKAWQTFRENGGEMVMFYNYSGMGASWRFVDETKYPTVSDTTSPKMKFLDSLACLPEVKPTLGLPVPGTVYLRDAASSIVTWIGGDTSWGYGGTAYRLNENVTDPTRGESFIVPIRSESQGRYALSVTTLDAAATARLDLYVNGEYVGVLIPSASNPAGAATETNGIEVNLPAGISAVRVRARVGSVWVKDVVALRL